MGIKRDKPPVKSFETNKEFKHFIESERAWMYDRIYTSIEYAHKIKEDYACIFEAKIGETMSVVTMKSHKPEWITSLTLALKFSENVENYEFCIKISNLINSIRTEE